MIAKDRFEMRQHFGRPCHLAAVEADLYAIDREQRRHARGVLAVPCVEKRAVEHFDFGGFAHVYIPSRKLMPCSSQTLSAASIWLQPWQLP